MTAADVLTGRTRRLVVCVLLAVLGPPAAQAQTPTVAPSQPAPQRPGPAPSAGVRREEVRPRWRSEHDDDVGWTYASRGLQFRSADGNWYQWFTLRNQPRFFAGFDGTPTSPEDFPEDGETDVVLQRSRFKFGGFLFHPSLADAVEIDLRNQQWYVFMLTWQAKDWLHVRAGQWKIEFNRERVTSSGEQLLVDRSIVNRDFTLDGQMGVMATGRLFGGRRAEAQYFAAVLAGEGRLRGNDDDVPMYFARYNWNFHGRTPAFQQSDVEYHAQPAGSVGVAVVTGRGRFTRYDSRSGTQLDGFEDGEPGQYDLRQWMADAVWLRRGFAAQGEHHWKWVRDRLSGVERRLRGGYVQAGYFPVHTWPWFPPELEVAGRLAYVDPDTASGDDIRGEYSFGANWYFNQHRNKISLDVSHLTVGAAGGTRMRLQWDLSI